MVDILVWKCGVCGFVEPIEWYKAPEGRRSSASRMHTAWQKHQAVKP